MKEIEKKLISHSYDVSSVQSEKEQAIESAPNHDDTIKAKQIIEEAQEKADQILLQTKDQIEEWKRNEQSKIDEWWNKKREEDAIIVKEVKANAFKDGYETGEKQAEEDLHNQYQEKFEEVKQILEEAFHIKEQMIQESETMMIELSTEIAEKIIMKEIELDQSITKTMAKEILKKTKESEKIAINVSPDYFSYLKNAREELLMELNGQVELSIYPDPSIDSGGCMIKTSYGTLDAKVDTQLEEIKKVLFDILGREQR